MDAAEIARLREIATHELTREGYTWMAPQTVLALLDALEQAQKERDETLGDRLEFTRQVMTFDKLAEESISEIESLTAQRDQAQKDAKDARVLLGEVLLENNLHYTLRPRIEDMLK